MQRSVWDRAVVAWSVIRKGAVKIAPLLPKILFCFSLIVMSSLYTYVGVRRHWFPFPYVELARKTALSYRMQEAARSKLSERYVGMTDIPRKDADRRRIVNLSPSTLFPENFLMTGDAYEYLRYCPGHGCLAAEFDRSGRLVHAYPFRADEFATKQTLSLPYETTLFAFDKDFRVNGLAKLPNGDLIVVFHQANTFPYGGGVARIDKQGHIVWYRHDYSHHWPTVLGSGEIAITSQTIAGPTLIGGSGRMSVTIDCGEKFGKDIIRILDMDGKELQVIPVLDALLASPYRSLMHVMEDQCDPTHLNYVRSVTPAIAAIVPGAVAGDLLISLRNLSAFAVVRRKDGKILQLFRGSFDHQHSVTPVANTTEVLIFDNWGVDRDAGPSRLLLYDLATGRERTILPNKSMPRNALFSSANGHIDVSSDGNRAVVAAAKAGLAYEVRLTDQAVLTKFDNLHDVSSAANFPDNRQSKAARFQLPGVYYVQ